MRYLQDARSALLLHCNNLAIMLEQSLDIYCNADADQEKEKSFRDIKLVSSQLVLLETFYATQSGKTQISQLQKLCILLGHENYQGNKEEQLALLIKIFQSLAQIPAPSTDKYTF